VAPPAYQTMTVRAMTMAGDKVSQCANAPMELYKRKVRRATTQMTFAVLDSPASKQNPFLGFPFFVRTPSLHAC